MIFFNDFGDHYRLVMIDVQKGRQDVEEEYESDEEEKQCYDDVTNML